MEILTRLSFDHAITVTTNDYHTMEELLAYLGGLAFLLKLMVSCFSVFLVMMYTINLVKLI